MRESDTTMLVVGLLGLGVVLGAELVATAHRMKERDGVPAGPTPPSWSVTLGQGATRHTIEIHGRDDPSLIRAVVVADAQLLTATRGSPPRPPN